MKIWLDADACPVPIKEILYKTAEREKIELIVVANNHFRTPRTLFIKFCHVNKGLDVADNEIIRRLNSKDIVITSDIPLAARAVEKQALALNPRGELYTEDNIKERLSTRDFLHSLRSSGIETGGPSSFTARDKQAFANSLDKIITQNKKQSTEVCSSGPHKARAAELHDEPIRKEKS